MSRTVKNKNDYRYFFENRTVLIATQHGKEKVIAPLLEKNLGVSIFVPTDMDTDVLGTFTGEIERKDEPVITLRKKCAMAMDKYGYDLAIASEGSFGPHPSLFFVPADDELVMLVDRKNKLEIIAREISADTNFNGAEISTEKQLRDFAEKVSFPSHSLILREEKEGRKKIIKGIVDWESLLKYFHLIKAEFGNVYAETDMRAMNNPTRMAVIEKATQKLLQEIQSCCPTCQKPGFGISKMIPGLPCEHCGLPTRSALKSLSICKYCEHQQFQEYPLHKKSEEALYCDYCNP